MKRIDPSRIPCAKEQCARCATAGRDEWTERVLWHADRARRRQSATRLVLLAAVPLVLAAVLIGVLS